MPRSRLHGELARRSFGAADQDWFAGASGDRNPLHVDEIAARRALFGQRVVHGVHSALWALDAWCATGPGSPATRLVATFAKPVFLDEEVAAVVGDADETSTHLRVVLGTTTLLTLRVHHDSSPRPAVLSPDVAPTGVPATPQDLTIEQMDGRAGALAVADDPGVWETAFPAVCGRLGAAVVARIAALSTLVGMECPGLHSLFGGFDVAIDRSVSPAALAWQVSRADPRFSIVQVKVDAGPIGGTVNAFARPAPTPQPTAGALAARVRAGEFAGVRALVVGGSRGLGELTAKLIAAGGGSVVVTWQHGSDDAERVANEIREAGGDSNARRLDVADPGTIEDVTHVFYFASPRITARRLAPFERDQFDRFVDVYVDGFVDVVRAAGRDVTAFYPSTVFVDDGPADLVEYAAAKAAGEVAAQRWADSSKGSRVVIERLPRLATDQTAALRPLELDDPVPLLLDAIRRTLAP